MQEGQSLCEREHGNDCRGAVPEVGTERRSWWDFGWKLQVKLTELASPSTGKQYGKVRYSRSRASTSCSISTYIVYDWVYAKCESGHGSRQLTIGEKSREEPSKVLSRAAFCMGFGRRLGLSVV